MRKCLLVAALLALPALPAFAGGPIKVSIVVGQQAALCPGCTNPICDDPKVAVLSADGKGILTAVGPGKTLCSIARFATQRQLYEIEVKLPPEAGKDGGK